MFATQNSGREPMREFGEFFSRNPICTRSKMIMARVSTVYALNFCFGSSFRFVNALCIGYLRVLCFVVLTCGFDVVFTCLNKENILVKTDFPCTCFSKPTLILTIMFLPAALDCH